MSLSKRLSTDYQEKINNSFVKQNLAKEFLENLEFSRNHPLYDDWKEWKEVVSSYYSKETGLFQKILFDSSAPTLSCLFDHTADGKVIHDAYCIGVCVRMWKGIHKLETKNRLSEILYSGRRFYPGDNDLFGTVTSRCPCVMDYWNNDQEEWNSNYPYENCKFQREHILNIFLSLIVHLSKNQSRRYRKYYRKLARIIYVLPLRFLLDIDINASNGLGDLLFNPMKVIAPGRNLLRQIYERGFFDKFYVKNHRDLPYWFEQMKHFRNNPFQQSGTSQSVSATMFDEIAQLVSSFPQQQSFPNIFLKHELKISDEQFTKFEETVERTHFNFMQSLKYALIDSAKEMMILFVFVATVAMLGYTVVKYGLQTIITTLELLYKVTIGKYFETSVETRIVQQDGGLSIPFLPSLVVNNVIAPPAKILSSVWNNPQTDRIMRRIGYLGDPKISRGVDKVTEWLQQVIIQTVNWYKEVILGLAPQEDIDTECSPVLKWYNDTDEYFRLYYSGELKWNDMNWSILMNLYGRGMALIRQNVYSEFKQDIWKIVFKLGNLLEKFNSHGRTGNSIRNPPVSIYLAGGTGVGKSSVTYPLAAEILRGIFQREPAGVDLAKYWKNLIYMRCPEQEFWDGYENQLVTIFDDFGQLVDTSASPNLELFEIVRAANSFPYPLHMASLDQKATTTFNSKIIMCSSNLDQPKTASLNFEQALFRRFDVCVKVTNKPGVERVPGKFDPSIYEFQLYDMATQNLGEFISYKDLVYMAVTKYFERKGFVDTMDDYITSMLNKSENPSQQSLGTALGNTVCNIKSGIKNTINYAYQNYYDFQGAMCGELQHRFMIEIRQALESFRYKLMRVESSWNNFRLEHKYIYKALKFVGIVTLIFGVVKLYNSMTTSSKKEKFMSMDQFVKSGNKIQSEAYVALKVKNPKVEGYAVTNVKNPKVELMCKHEYDVNGCSDICVIDNSQCEICCDDKVSQDRLFGPKQEAYVQPNVKNPRVEGLLPITPTYVCEHEFSTKFKLNPFRHYFLKINPTCNKCVPENPQQEGVRDVNASEILAKIIRSNFYKIYSVDKDEAIGHCIFLRGQIVICPRHYVVAFQRLQGNGGSNRIYLKNVFVKRSFEIDVSEILEKAFYYESPEEGTLPVLSRDLMAFPVTTATFHSNIVPFFADKNSLNYVKGSDVMMPVLINNNLKDSERAIVAFRYAKGHSSLVSLPEQAIDNENGLTVRIIRNMWNYSMDTQPSECGAPLIVRNVNIGPGKIIGLHVAGHHNGSGYATPVYKQDVEYVLSKFNPYDSVEFRLKGKYGEYPIQQCQVPEEAEFIRIGSVERPVAQPTKSKIEPSPLFNKIKDVETRPCLLRTTQINGEEFNPRTYRLGRLGNIPQFIRNLEVDLAVQALVDDISDNIKQFDFGPNIKPRYSFEEAVVGIDGEEFINSIKRNTSPGYPFVHLKGFENRKTIFGDDEKCNMDLPQCKIMQARVESIIDMCKQGVITEHIFMDTLKDERKPLHKSHKTRLFSAGPLDYLIACKMYFNGIVAVLQKARNYSGISVGTNVYSQDWSVIVQRILSKSPNIIAGDFEGFDASQSQRLLMGAGRVLIELSKRFCGTTDEDAFVMWCLLISLFNSVHITGKEIYQWTHSLPSGHYLTAVINSIFVLVSFCVVWQIHKKNASYVCARRFYKTCGKVAYGDDHVISVPQNEPDFNQQTLIGLFKQIGLSYTMEDKDAVASSAFRKITEVSYLKRKFVFNKDYQQWLSPLDLKTVLESPMWLHKCPDPIDQTKAQIDNSLRELSLHDGETWNKWYPVFAKCGKQIGHYTEFVDHAETRAEVLLN